MAYGYGTTFSRSTDNVTFTQVAGLVDIEPPEVTRDVQETTLMDNSDGANGTKTFQGGMRDTGEISLTLHWNPDDAGQQALKADLETDSARYYRITYPDNTTMSMRAVLSSWGQAVPIDNRITRTCKFKVSGPITEVT